MKEKILKAYYKIFGKYIMNKNNKLVMKLIHVRSDLVTRRLECSVFLCYKPGLSQETRNDLIQSETAAKQLIKEISNKIIGLHNRNRKISNLIR